MNAPRSGPAPTAWDFKGHPQPPVDDRLSAARNFLSDEDSDRCLQFDEKFAEIEELVAGIKKQGLEYDPDLLRNVEIKIQEHHAWKKYHDGWTDTCCRDRPPKARFSTRLIDATTTDLVKKREKQLGIVGYTRPDAPPFTTERERDHRQFMLAMKAAATQDPNTGSTVQNLLVKEHRAYDWAIRDPAFIPLWMHPTKGIPKTGTTDVDEIPWYRQPAPPPDFVRLLPDRGWIPDYLLARESRINGLLKSLQYLTSAQFQELDDLLREHYPEELQVLWDQYQALVRSQAINMTSTGLELRALTPQEIAWKDKIKKRFDQKHEYWIKSFAITGVYIMVRKPLLNNIEVDAPGVFYVDDSVVNGDRATTLTSARTMLDFIQMNGSWTGQNLTQEKQMSILVRDCQPQNIRDLVEQRDAILETRGVVRPDQLEQTQKQAWNRIDETARAARAVWFDQAMASGTQFEVQYLRPAEMKQSNNPGLIYLPWHMEVMPDGETPNPQREFPADVKELEDKINARMLRLHNNHSVSVSLERGDQELNELLMNVAYPKLRRLLVPWVAIKIKRDLGRPTMPVDDATWPNIDTEVSRLWEDWLSGFDFEKGIRIKLPTSQMLPESPDILYYRHPTGTQVDATTHIQTSERVINALLQTPNTKNPLPGESSTDFKDRMKRLANDIVAAAGDFKYPELFKAQNDLDLCRSRQHDDIRNKTPPATATDWSDFEKITTDLVEGMRQRWARSLLGHTITIKRCIPKIDPDNSPSVVYYRGALPAAEATKTVRDCMDVTIPAETAIENLKAFYDVDTGKQLFPERIKYLQGVVADNPMNRIEKDILTWHYDCLVNGPLAMENARGFVDELGVWRCTYINSKQQIFNRGGEIDLCKTTPPPSQATGRMRLLGGGSTTTTLPPVMRMKSRTSLTNTTNTTFRGSNRHPFRTANGYYTRPPCKPRTVGIHPELGVDLELFRDQITYVERELNMMCQRIRVHQRSGDPESAIQSIRRRFYDLIEQCIPQPLVDMNMRDQAYACTIRAPAPPASRTDRSNYDRRMKNLEAMRRETAGLIDAWIQSLVDSPLGIYIERSENLEDIGDGKALILNKQYTKTGKDFKFKAPRDTSPSTPLGTSELMSHTAQTKANSDIFQSERRFRNAFLNRIKARINELLAKRKNEDNLNWEDSEELLDKLYGFMLPGLSALEGELWQLDEKLRYTPPLNGPARLPPPTAEDVEKYLRLNERWQAAYDSWLDTLPTSPTGIVIQNNRSSQPARGELFIEDPNFWDHWPSTDYDVNSDVRKLSRRRAARSRVLPQFVQDNMRTINAYLESNTPFTYHDCKNALIRSMVRRCGQKNRALTHNALQIRPNDVIRPELDVVIECTQSMGFRIHRQRMRDRIHAGSAERAHLIEYGAGHYIHYFGAAHASMNNLTSSFPPNYITEREKEATMVWNRIWHHPLYAQERANFLAFAARLRNLNGISNTDLQNLLMLLNQTTSEPQHTRGDALWNLYHNSATWPPDDVAQATMLTRYQQSFLIHRFARMYPEILDAMVVGPTLLTVEQLIHDPRPGEQPLPRIPDIARPSEAEIRQLEIEINNLLYREGSGTMSGRDALELDFLLESFLPKDIAVIKSQLDELQINRLQLPGLNTNEEFAYNAYRQDFAQKFAAFKQGIGPAGILIDKWWFTDDDIAKGCSRARMWARAIVNDKNPGVYPSTSNTLESEDMRQWHEIYLDMRDYALSFSRQPARERRLFYDILPNNLSKSKADVNNLKRRFAALFVGNASPSDTTILTEAAYLQDVMRQFVTLWTEWLLNTPASNIPVLRRQIREGIAPNAKDAVGAANHQGNRIQVDFSSKAERRGIKRAAIELALNILATNQEQHRPSDIYRRVDLPRPYKPLDEGMPLSLPLEPWNRPVELDTFEYTKKILNFHQAKDKEYSIARAREIDIHPSEILVPPNFNGPFAKTDVGDLEWAKREWLRELVTIFRALQDAYALAPRPFLQELLNCAGQGFAMNATHPLHDDPPLTRDEVRLIAELTEPSWDDVRMPYPTLDRNTPGYNSDLALQWELQVFEKELELLDWQDRTWLPAYLPNTALYAQPRYDASLDTTQGYTITVITQHVNNNRLAMPSDPRTTPALLSQQTVVTYFAALQSLRRIHMNLTAAEPLDTLVAKIPVCGHPENKYILSRNDAKTASGVSLDPITNSYVVQYDAKGNKGPPIIQPNKIGYLQSIAYRIGRDTEQALRSRINPGKTPDQLLAERYQCLVDTETRMVGDRPDQNALTIEDMAMELHKIAPDLAENAQITSTIPIDSAQPNGPYRFNARESAMLLQMQILEELNNCWEPRFPEKESIWDFAADRLRPQTVNIHGRQISGARRRITQYFDVRRFPPGCQEPETKAAILESGPEFVERPMTPPATPPLAWHRRDGGGGGGNDRHGPGDDGDDDDGNDNGNGGTFIPMTRRRKYRPELDKSSKGKFKGGRAKGKENEDAENNEGAMPNAGTRNKKANNAKRPPLKASVAQQQAAAMRKQARHLIGSRPHFPFGETPYQAAYHSFIMENDLRDVPEFQPVVPRVGLFARKPSPEPKDPFALPTIPDEWEPDNISFAEKRAQLIELAKKTDGFPDSSILENYHTPEEIKYLEQERRFKLHHAELAAAQDAITKFHGKRYEQLTPMEYNEACEKLNINKQTSKFNPDSPADTSAGGGGMGKRGLRPGGNRRRDPSKARGNENDNGDKNGGGDDDMGGGGGSDTDNPGTWNKLKRTLFGEEKSPTPEKPPIDSCKAYGLSDSEDTEEDREIFAAKDRMNAQRAKEREEAKKKEVANLRKRGSSPVRKSPRKKAKS